MTQEIDVIIIGAGAAGLMAAAVAGARGKRVVVLDHAEFLGEKIRISGGGRCNFTNLGCTPTQFISENPHFCKSALTRFTPQDFIAMVERHGIAWHEKTLGQLFCDDSAQLIIDMLMNECRDGGVRVKLKTEVRSIYKYDGGYSLKTTEGEFKAPILVIATGGPSIPKIGATGFAYDVAKQFGLKVVKPRPALVPLTFTDDILTLARDISGLAVEAAEISCNGMSFREGLLFTHRGISGPSVLQISSYWSPGDALTINLAPDRDVLAWLKELRLSQPRRHIHTIIGECVPQRLADRLMERAGLTGPIADLSDKKLQIAADTINQWRVVPNGSEGYRTAEVAAGGIDTTELSSKTFEVRNVPGLYFIGECVDVTGWLGGYNFQWAWSSGWACGQAV